MTGLSSVCPPFHELADYWVSDLAADDLARIEAHVFECPSCTALLTVAEGLARGVAQLVRAGRIQAVVSDEVLNRLARDGVRMRTYVLEPGAVVPCAVWSDDELLVVRLRGDFSGHESISVLTEFSTGGTDRVDDVCVEAGGREIVEVIPAAHLRDVPRTAVRLTVLAGAQRPIAHYVLEHAGTFSRDASDEPSPDQTN